MCIQSRVGTRVCCSSGRANVSAWIPPQVPSSQGPGALCSPSDMASLMLQCSLGQGFCHQSGFAALSDVVCLDTSGLWGSPSPACSPVCVPGRWCVVTWTEGFGGTLQSRDTGHWPQLGLAWLCDRPLPGRPTPLLFFPLTCSSVP